MKRHIIFFLIIVTLLTGCSSGNVIEGSTKTREIEEVSDNDDIKIIKFYVLLMSQYDRKRSLLADFKSDAVELLTAVKYRFPPKNYREIIEELDIIAENHRGRLSSMESDEEMDEKFLTLAEAYSLENFKYVEDLEEINKTIRDIEREYSNAYEQIEYYIKNNDLSHIDKYIVYQNKFRDLWEELDILLMRNKNEINGIILDY